MTDALADDLNLRVFSYAVAEKADLYVAVVEALVAAEERFVLQLRPAEVAQQVSGITTEEVATALEALEGWGNVTKFYDTAAPRRSTSSMPSASSTSSPRPG
jgi:Protein of unknown function (DUF2397)